MGVYILHCFALAGNSEDLSGSEVCTGRPLLRASPGVSQAAGRMTLSSTPTSSRRRTSRSSSPCSRRRAKGTASFLVDGADQEKQNVSLNSTAKYSSSNLCGLFIFSCFAATKQMTSILTMTAKLKWRNWSLILKTGSVTIIVNIYFYRSPP